MSRQELALRALQHAAGFVAAVCFLMLAIIRDLAVEIADEIRASRQPKRLLGGNMSRQSKNIKLWDSTSQLKAANARLAAIVGNSTVAAGEASDGRQLAAEMAMVRRTS